MSCSIPTDCRSEGWRDGSIPNLPFLWARGVQSVALHTRDIKWLFKIENREQKKFLIAHRRSRRKGPYSADWVIAKFPNCSSKMGKNGQMFQKLPELKGPQKKRFSMFTLCFTVLRGTNTYSETFLLEKKATKVGKSKRKWPESHLLCSWNGHKRLFYSFIEVFTSFRS